MRHVIALAVFGLLCSDTANLAAEWNPVTDSMLTRWGRQVVPGDVWQEYPRPQMVRPEWHNLNGLWNYAVTGADAAQPATWDAKILVPFAIEAPLSGVGRRLKADEALWYQREFNMAAVQGKLLLHFEAVDYRCEVWVNNQLVGSHVGGNLPFTLDITPAAKPGENTLVVKVLDATDAIGRYQLTGKQRVNNRGIFYTPVSGIWQTVWLEQVPRQSVRDLKMTGGADGLVSVSASVDGQLDTIRVLVKDGAKTVASASGPVSDCRVKIEDPRLWSPDSPFLYDVVVELLDADGKAVDSVQSYVGLRTVGKERDSDGNYRLTLNGQPLFHWGPLDQGWWPDGLLTPPADAAMLFEIEFLKRAGFNMIRKHIKVEPRRYYYHCDRLGMLVWQDHVSGGANPPANEWPKWKRLANDHEKGDGPQSAREGDPLDAVWPDAAHQQFMAELKGMVDHLYNHPSIVTWIPFNERWGQHRTMDVGHWIVQYDPSRLINIASGGNFFPVGDMADEHAYPHPSFPLNDDRYDGFAKIVGEFGGHGWPVVDHQWSETKRRWGYGGLPKTKQEYIERYRESINRLGKLKEQGIAGAVYTQTTDVEGEINGLMTYDRDVIKISAGHLNQMAEEAGIIAGGHRLSGTRPNIILVMVDDMGYSDLGCYGGEIETPNIDALAAAGLKFTQFYNQGRCCPTRASLMTGLQPHQVGIGHMTAPPGQPLGFTGAYQGYLNGNCTTLAEVLKSAGYHTLMTGKWHLGVDSADCWPLQRGFDRYYGCLSGAINYFKPGGDRGITVNNQPVVTPDGWYATDAFTEQAIQFIDEADKSDERPFFLYLAYNAPHWPLNAKWEDYQKYRGRYRDGWQALMKRRQAKQRELGLFPESTRPAPHPGPAWESLSEQQRDRLDAVMAAYAGCVDSIDQNIGRLVRHLKQTGELENTLILFLSDNGACQEGGPFGRGDEAMVKDPPLETVDGVRIGLHWAGACNTPFRKYKHFVHEGGACTPFIAHWPAGIAAEDQGTIIRRHAYLQDVMATVVDLSGGRYPADLPRCEGKSIGPLLAGIRQSTHFDPMFWEHEGNAAVRHGRWKLVREYQKPWELYDIQADRTELNDLAAMKPRLRDDLIQMWEEWAKATQVAFPERFNMYEFLNERARKQKDGN